MFRKPKSKSAVRQRKNSVNDEEKESPGAQQVPPSAAAGVDEEESPSNFQPKSSSLLSFDQEEGVCSMHNS